MSELAPPVIDQQSWIVVRPGQVGPPVAPPSEERYAWGPEEADEDQPAEVEAAAVTFPKAPTWSGPLNVGTNCADGSCAGWVVYDLAAQVTSHGKSPHTRARCPACGRNNVMFDNGTRVLAPG